MNKIFLILLFLIPNISKSQNIKIINLCDSSMIVLNKDKKIIETLLLYDGLLTNINTDTFYVHYNGYYTLNLFKDSTIEYLDFQVENESLNQISELIIPYKQIPISDPFIIPSVKLNYNTIQIVWDFGDGNSLFDNFNPLHRYEKEGVYNLSVIIISNTGCARYFTEFISVYNTSNSLSPLISPKRIEKNIEYDLGKRVVGMNYW